MIHNRTNKTKNIATKTPKLFRISQKPHTTSYYKPKPTSGSWEANFFKSPGYNVFLHSEQ